MIRMHRFHFSNITETFLEFGDPGLRSYHRNMTPKSQYQPAVFKNKCQTVDPDRQNLGWSGMLSFFIIYKFWQNCASVRQVSDIILKTGSVIVHCSAPIYMYILYTCIYIHIYTYIIYRYTCIYIDIDGGILVTHRPTKAGPARHFQCWARNGYTVLWTATTKVENPGSSDGPSMLDRWVVRATFEWSVYTDAFRNDNETTIS